jgi:hypothetical protein
MTLRILRRAVGLAILGVGAVHLQQYLGAGYSSIPTIGTLFLLNAIGSAIVGLAMLAPLEAALSDRAERAVTGVLAAAAALIATGSLAALFVSETGTLFGFAESGYRAAIVAAIVLEAVTVATAVPLAVVELRRTLAVRPRRRPEAAAARPSEVWSGR